MTSRPDTPTYHAATRSALLVERAGLIAARPRTHGAEGIFALEGPVGEGKTTELARTNAAVADSLYLRLRATDSALSVATRLCTELMLTPGRTTAKCFEAILYELRVHPRLLLIDEAQNALGCRVLHLLRDLHDEAPETRLLIAGDQTMRARLQRQDDISFHSRIVAWFRTLPLDVTDVSRFARVYAPKVEITDDLVELVVLETGGNARKVSMLLRQLAEMAQLDRISRLDAKAWRSRQSPSGAPSLRVVS